MIDHKARLTFLVVQQGGQRNLASLDYIFQAHGDTASHLVIFGVKTQLSSFFLAVIELSTYCSFICIILVTLFVLQVLSSKQMVLFVIHLIGLR